MKLIGFAAVFGFSKIYRDYSAMCLTKESLDKKLIESYRRNQKVDADFSNVVLLSGNANKELASDIASILGVQLGKMKCGRFADGEV